MWCINQILINQSWLLAYKVKTPKNYLKTRGQVVVFSQPMPSQRQHLHAMRQRNEHLDEGGSEARHQETLVNLIKEEKTRIGPEKWSGNMVPAQTTRNKNAGDFD